MTSRLKALLLDVGGTLWQDNWRTNDDHGQRVRQVGQTLPAASTDQVDRMVTLLEELRTAIGGTGAYRVEDDVLLIARSVGVAIADEQLPLLRQAMSVPVPPDVLLDGARELAAVGAQLGLATVVVSNTTWRDAEEYRRDFATLGLGHHVHHYVTSVDAGYRKPHPAMFHAALALAGCEAHEALMVGNSETADIAPASALGMRTVRVDIESTGPATTLADAVVTDLHAAAGLIAAWVAKPFATEPATHV